VKKSQEYALFESEQLTQGKTIFQAAMKRIFPTRVKISVRNEIIHNWRLFSVRIEPMDPLIDQLGQYLLSITKILRSYL